MKRVFVLAAALLTASCVGDAEEPAQVGGSASAYRISELVGPSAFHGIHGIAVAPDGKLLVGSVVGQAIYEVDPANGHNRELIGPPDGMADDIAFAPDGTMAWTGFLTGKVFVQKPGGKPLEVASGLPGANSLAFTKDGRLYFTQVFLGDALHEADVSGKKPARKIAEKLGGLNGFDVGKDGRIYGPIWFKGQIAAVDPRNGKVEVIVDGFKVPAAANFDSKGNLWAIDTVEGALYRINVKKRTRTKVAQLSPALDNLAVDKNDNIYITNMADNAIHRVDPNTGAVSEIIKGKVAATADLAIAHDGNDMLHLADVFAYRQIDTKTGQVSVKRRMFGDEVDYPSGVGVGPKRVVLSGLTSGAVQILDRATGSSLALLHGFKGPTDAAETEDGRILVLEAGSGSLLAVEDLKGETRTVVASGLKDPVAMASSGTSVYVTCGDGTVVHVDLRSGAKHVVVNKLSGPEGIDVTPDGHLIVAEVGAKRVVSVNPKTGVVEVVASQLAIGLPAPGGQGAFLTTGVAVDKNGTIYVSADEVNAILKIER